MTDYLLFTLAAPMASFGAVAVGERRPTWDRPGKSQVIGLVAGALGIERTNEERQRALAASLGFAVRIDVPGQLAADYHTAQVPPQRRNRRFATRREELAVPRAELKTILSEREFLTDCHATVCLWLRATGPASLAEIGSALEQPRFAPFVGRKAHVLMLPMWPQIVAADDVTAAFVAFDGTISEAVREIMNMVQNKKLHREPFIFVDADAVDAQAVEWLEQRRDVPESRDKWRFGIRAEALLRPRTRMGDAR